MTAELTEQVESVQAAVSDLSPEGPARPGVGPRPRQAARRGSHRAPWAAARRAPRSPARCSPRRWRPRKTRSARCATCSAGSTSRLELAQGDLDRRAELLRRDAVDLAGARRRCRPRSATREDPFGGDAASSTPGIDISADRGQPVFATADGTVESAGWNGDYGNLVVDRPRLRPGDPLRPPVGVLGAARASTSSAAQVIGLRRRDRPHDRAAPALRAARQRAADQPAHAADRRPPALTAAARPAPFP